jgi:hypothetical protein
VADYNAFSGVDETVPASSQTNVAGTIEDNEQNVHQLTPIVTLTGTNYEISNVSLVRIWRDGDGTTGTDDYTGDACLLSVDIHVQKNTVGSPLETSK